MLLPLSGVLPGYTVILSFSSKVIVGNCDPAAMDYFIGQPVSLNRSIASHIMSRIDLVSKNLLANVFSQLSQKK